MRRLLGVIILLVPACAGPARCLRVEPPAPSELLVLVADGAGDYRACSASVRATVADAGLPITVETFPWSHGYRRNLRDQIDHTHSREMGSRLAARVMQAHVEQPGRPVALIGHSAGAAVALAAAGELPPDTLVGVALLAPSVSCRYDLRPALRASRGGIDNHASTADRIWLGTFTTLVGTADGGPRRAAGRWGFDDVTGAADHCARLHQWFWTPELKALGHDGGHFGAYQPGYLRAIVLPQLLNHGGIRHDSSNAVSTHCRPCWSRVASE